MKLLVADENAIDAVHRKLYDNLVSSKGIDLRLVVPSKWSNNFKVLSFEPPTESPNYQIFGTSVLFRTRNHRLMYIGLDRHLREFQPDVFYMYSEPENFAMLQAARLNRSPTKLVFYTARNLDHVHIGYPYKMSFLNRWIERFVLPRASHGVACNAAARELFALHGFPNITVIPLSVDTDLFVPAMQPRKDGRFVIGYVGRLAGQKGVDLILSALARLPRDCSARLIGGGPEQSNLMQLAGTLGLLTRVEFVASVYRAALPALLSKLDVLVLPSRTTRYWKEQFGRVLIEAMACGVPVVGSDSGEIPNVIGDAGIVFKEGNAEELAQALRRLHDDAGLRSELREKGLRRVKELYSVERVAAQYAALFKSLVET
jgi:glycosyltransferase involved in cell wall biosynthesis